MESKGTPEIIKPVSEPSAP